MQLSLLRRCLHSAQAVVPRARGGLTVLGYHLVGAPGRSVVNLPLDAFERHLDELSGCACVRPLDEALERLDQGVEAEHPDVVLTFDDGYENFYRIVWPLLRERGLPATVYVHVDFVDKRLEGPISTVDNLRALTWEQLAELVAGGLVKVGSHTCSHPDLTRLRGEELRHELEDSRRILEERLGVAVDSFCYPRGRWSRRVEKEVVRHYRTAVVRGGRTMRPGNYSPYRLERVPLRRDTTQSLEQIVDSTVWLEEWAASKVRRVIG